MQLFKEALTYNLKYVVYYQYVGGKSTNFIRFLVTETKLWHKSSNTQILSDKIYRTKNYSCMLIIKIKEFYQVLVWPRNMRCWYITYMMQFIALKGSQLDAHFAMGHIVLLHWIQTLLSLKIWFFFQLE